MALDLLGLVDSLRVIRLEMLGLKVLILNSCAVRLPKNILWDENFHKFACGTTHTSLYVYPCITLVANIVWYMYEVYIVGTAMEWLLYCNPPFCQKIIKELSQTSVDTIMNEC